MAKVFFHKHLKFNLLPDFMEFMKTMLLSIEDKDSDDYKDWMKIALFTCRGSEYLVSIFKEAMRNRWNIFNPDIDVTKLNRSQIYMLDFLESGIIDLIAKSREYKTLEPLVLFITSPFAKATYEVINTWNIEKGKNPNNVIQ